MRTRLGILRVYKKGAKPLKRGQTDRYLHNFDVFPREKDEFLKKDRYPSRLSIMQLTSSDFRHKSARRVRTRHGTLDCTAPRHYLQRASNSIGMPTVSDRVHTGRLKFNRENIERAVNFYFSYKKRSANEREEEPRAAKV